MNKCHTFSVNPVPDKVHYIIQTKPYCCPKAVINTQRVIEYYTFHAVSAARTRAPLLQLHHCSLETSLCESGGSLYTWSCVCREK